VEEHAVRATNDRVSVR